MIRTEVEARSWLANHPKADAVALARLEMLAALLIEENLQQNLVSTSSLDELWRRHIIDSAQLLHFSSDGVKNWLDLGTGAGFPGLVIAALRPELLVTMIESRPRRAEWLERARIALGLCHANVVCAQLERVKSAPFQVISARAFAPLTRLLQLSARFSTERTLWLLPKGRSAQQELDQLKVWPNRFHVEQSLTDGEAGIIVGHLLAGKGGSS